MDKANQKGLNTAILGFPPGLPMPHRLRFPPVSIFLGIRFRPQHVITLIPQGVLLSLASAIQTGGVFDESGVAEAFLVRNSVGLLHICDHSLHLFQEAGDGGVRPLSFEGDTLDVDSGDLERDPDGLFGLVVQVSVLGDEVTAWDTCRVA
jgi:hypothetical protein